VPENALKKSIIFNEVFHQHNDVLFYFRFVLKGNKLGNILER